MQDPWFDMYEGPNDMDRTLKVSTVAEKSSFLSGSIRSALLEEK